MFFFGIGSKYGHFDDFVDFTKIGHWVGSGCGCSLIAMLLCESFISLKPGTMCFFGVLEVLHSDTLFAFIVKRGNLDVPERWIVWHNVHRMTCINYIKFRVACMYC